jgi:hypothetical protein
MNSRLALIVFLDGSGNYPDQGLPPFQGGPDNSLPGGRPEHPWFPGHRPERPDNSLPIFPGRPGQGLPGGGFPGQGRPDNSLPGQGDRPSQGPGFPTQLPVFPSDPSKPPKPDGERPDNSLPEEGKLFELKWSPYYGWVLVPVEDETAQPKPTPKPPQPPERSGR